MKKHKFSPDSKRIEDYEMELLFLSKSALIKPDDSTILDQYNFVFDCMKKNSIRHSGNIKSRIFEYAVLNHMPKLANSILQNNHAEGHKPIQAEFLHKYFDNCLKRDNFDGVAYLANYCTSHQISMSAFDIGKFHNAVHHYLNVNFNLSKVMIFTKFYSQYYTSRQKQVLRQFKNLDL